MRLKILQIEDEQVMRGDYEVGAIFINGGSLTIYGNINARVYIYVNNGSLIVSEKLSCDGDLISDNADISMRNCEVRNIYGERTSIYCAGNILCNEVNANKTDIFTTSMDVSLDVKMPNSQLEVLENLEAENMEAENIIVHGDTWVKNVHCFDYLIDGQNESRNVEAIKIYILGENISWDLKAAEIFLGSDADLCGGCIQATHHFEAGGVLRKVHNLKL